MGGNHRPAEPVARPGAEAAAAPGSPVQVLRPRDPQPIPHLDNPPQADPGLSGEPDGGVGGVRPPYPPLRGSKWGLGHHRSSGVTEV